MGWKKIALPTMKLLTKKRLKLFCRSRDAPPNQWFPFTYLSKMLHGYQLMVVFVVQNLFFDCYRCMSLNHFPVLQPHSHPSCWYALVSPVPHWLSIWFASCHRRIVAGLKSSVNLGQLSLNHACAQWLDMKWLMYRTPIDSMHENRRRT